MTASSLPGFVRLSTIETNLAYPFERRARHQAVSTVAGGSARTILEAILTDALAPGPCYLTFSGGRDSSALLALAVHVARREGLAMPVPVTAIYPDAPASDEERWQRLVLDHLGVTDRVVVELHDEQRLLGPSATAALRRRGAMWPEATALQGPLLAGLDQGAALVTGEGGDNVIAAGRGAPLWAVLHTWPPRRRLLRGAARALVERPSPYIPPWLTAEAADMYRTHVTHHREPWRWTARTHDAVTHPAAQVLFPNVRAAIAECGLHPVLPFVDPGFLAALAREGGVLGFGGRGRVFEHLVGDLLPREVVFRTSKASFNQTRWGEAEHGFARRWDGSGLEPRWVDAELLRAEWLSNTPHPACDFLLHVAWTAQHGGPPDQTERTDAR